MGRNIVIGKKTEYGRNKFLLSSRASKCISVFGASGQMYESISNHSQGLKMLIARPGTFRLSKFKRAIEQMQADLEGLEKENIEDYSSATDEKNLLAEFIYTGFQDRLKRKPNEVTQREVKIILRSILNTIRWARNNFGNRVAISIE